MTEDVRPTAARFTIPELHELINEISCLLWNNCDYGLPIKIDLPEDLDNSPGFAELGTKQTRKSVKHLERLLAELSSKLQQLDQDYHLDFGCGDEFQEERTQS